MGCYIVEMYVLVTPLEVVDNPLVSQLLFNNEYVLEKIDYSLLDVEMVKLSNHGFLVFQVSFILVDQCIPFIYHVSNVVKNCAVGAHIKLSKSLGQILVLLLLSLKLVVHVFDLYVVSFQLSHNQLLVHSSPESLLNFSKTHCDVWQLLDVSFRIFGAVKKGLCFFFKHINLIVKNTNLVFEIRFIKFINVDDVVISMFANGASEADTRTAIFTKSFHILAPMVMASENAIIIWGWVILLWLRSRATCSRYTRCIVLHVVVHF